RAWAIQNSTKAIPAAPRSAIRVAFGASNGLVHGADRGRLCPRDQARPGGHRATAAAHHQLDAGVDVAVVAHRTDARAGDRLLADVGDGAASDAGTGGAVALRADAGGAPRQA